MSRLLAALETEQKRRRDTNRIASFFPDEGPYRRELYVKHMEFFALGAVERERGFMAANRVGKTIVGAYETALHLTGEYPDWWIGRRFDGPVDWWAAGDTSETTRDIVQKELLGPIGDFGTGMIPQRCIVGEPTKRMGVAGAVDTIRVRHASGGVSTIGLKSYDQGRKKFQGTRKHGIWPDEEPPMDVYSEMLLRTMATGDFEGGIIMATFTPLLGLSDVALRFMPEHQAEG